MVAPYTYVTDAECLPSVAQAITESEEIALDLETTGFDPHTCRIRLCSVRTVRGNFVVDVFKTGTLGPIVAALHNPNEEVGRGRPVCIGQNLQFDQLFLLHHYGIELWPVFDTFRASALIYAGYRQLGHNLWDIYKRELGLAPTVEDLGGSDWSGVLTKAQLDYAADDTENLPACKRVLREKLRERGLLRVALIESGAILPEAAVIRRGFHLDREKWLALAADNRKKADGFADTLLRALPSPTGQLGLFGFDPKFNLDSNPQLLKSLRQHLGVGPDRLIDTKEDSLAPFAKTDPLVKLVLDYREVSKAHSAFGPDYLQHINARTGRVHAGYFPMLVTGRYAHMHPNLGSVPRKKEFRACFTAEPGNALVIRDWSNVEMVIAAELSGDPTLCAAFNNGEDVHRKTAARIAKIAEEAVTKAQRQQAKPCIAEGQLVLTDRGLVPIELVDLSDAVWDGEAWVRHGGVVCRGLKEVMEYEGLVATPDHVVYLDDGRAVSLRAAASALEGGRLARGGAGGVPLGYARAHWPGRSGRAEGRALRGGNVLGVLHHVQPVSLEYPAQEDHELSLSAGGQVRGRPSREGARGALRCPSPALHEPAERHLQELRRAWDQVSLRVEGALRPVDAGEPSARFVQGGADRPDEQRWSLRAWEPPTRLSAGEPAEQAQQPPRIVFRGAGAPGGSSGPHSLGLPALHPGGSHGSPLPEQHASDAASRGGSAARWGERRAAGGARYAVVYDILDAGPRNRFTVSGVVVSNCNFGFLYGMGAERFIAYALTGYGAVFDLKGAKEARAAYFDLYAGLRRWHFRALDEVKSAGCSRTIAGRLRWLNAETDYSEIFNTPVQGTGADALKTALRRAYRKLRDTPYGIVHHVHDEIVVEGPDDPEGCAMADKILEESMREAIQPMLKRVPAKSEGGVAKSWAEK